MKFDDIDLYNRELEEQEKLDTERLRSLFL